MVSAVVIITSVYLAVWISVRRCNRILGKPSRPLEQDRRLAKTLFLTTALSVITYLSSGITIAFGSYSVNLYSFRVQITAVVLLENSFLNTVVCCFKMAEFGESLNNLRCRCLQQSLPGTAGEVTSIFICHLVDWLPHSYVVPIRYSVKYFMWIKSTLRT